MTIHKKFQKQFFAAQEKVHQVFKDAGRTYRCIAQFTDKAEAMEVFTLWHADTGETAGIVAVRYMCHRADEIAGVFFFYDECMVGPAVGINDLGKWSSSVSIISKFSGKAQIAQ